jgi:hypothetical protein
MMQRMMNAMIRSMSVQQREQIMLRMMPEMMKGADKLILMKNMMTMMGKQISLWSLISFLSKASADEELSVTVKGKADQLKERMPGMMKEMMPVMKPLMKNAMPTMMKNMMIIMGPMMENMKTNNECMMADIVDEHPEIKSHMGEMMGHMCPQMAEKVIPADQRETFIKNVVHHLLPDQEAVIDDLLLSSSHKTN